MLPSLNIDIGIENLHDLAALLLMLRAFYCLLFVRYALP